MKRLVTACLLPLALWACGTDAVGVAECRRIEGARCEAAAKCGSVDDVEECKRFYDDHCLHGLAIEEAPRSKVVSECVSAIKAAGTCAAEHSAKTAPDECGNKLLVEADARQICDVVEEPERAPQCSFLLPDQDEDEDEDKEESEPDAGAEDPGSGKTSRDAG